MNWRCLICGVRFDAPVIRERKENLDGENGIEVRRERSCPVCGEDHMEEVSDDEQTAE